MGCCQAFDTCPDGAPSGKNAHTRVGPPLPSLSQPVPLSTHLEPKSLKVSFSGNHQTPHSWDPEQGRNWLGSFLLSPAPGLPTTFLPSSTVFMTQGSEHVPTSLEPASPTHITLLAPRLPASHTTRSGTLPTMGTPQLLTCRLPHVSLPSSPSRKTQMLSGMAESSCIRFSHVLPILS